MSKNKKDSWASKVFNYAKTEVDYFAVKKGFETRSGFWSWASLWVTDKTLKFFDESAGIPPGYAKQQLNDIKEKDKFNAESHPNKTIIEKNPNVILKELHNIIENTKVYAKEELSEERRSMKELRLVDDSIQFDGKNMVIKYGEYSATFKGVEKGVAQMYGAKGMENKFEKQYNENIEEFQGHLDKFFEDNKEKLQTEKGREQLVKELSERPSMRLIDDEEGINISSRKFVEDYQSGRQKEQGAFTNSGVRMVVSKFTKLEIEEDSNSKAIVNGKVQKEYQEFCDKQRNRALEEVKELEKKYAAGEKTDYLKAKISANKEIAQTWDVGDSRSLNMTQQEEENIKR